MVLNAVIEIPLGLVAYEAFDIFRRRDASFAYCIAYGLFVGLYLVFDVLFVSTLDSFERLIVLRQLLIVLITCNDVQELLIHHIYTDGQYVAEHVAHEFFVLEDNHVLIRGSLLERTVPLA